MMVRRAVAAALLSVSVLTVPGHSALASEALVSQPPSESPSGETAPLSSAPVLTLDQALGIAEANNPGLQLARYQLAGSRGGGNSAQANLTTLTPIAAAYLQVQYGIQVEQSAITPEVAAAQARYSYEQAAADYYDARQQVRAGTLQAYVEWQKAVALVEAQEAGLDRVMTQEANVKAALEVGSAAQYDLLQIQAAVAGQQAALIGARAMEAGARYGLEQVIGVPLSPAAQPEPNQLRAAEVVLPNDLNSLLAQAMINRPDLRSKALDLASRRLQLGLGGAGSFLQLQVAATQYELAAAQARMEVQQSLLSAQGALEELKAREVAVEPAREAVRLADLRYEAGIATLVEVQGASATLLQAEASRIQAAANLALRLLKLRQAVGEL